MKIRLTVLLGALTTALLAAGCGSSDDDGTTDSGSTKTISRAEFVKQGNKICAEGNEAIAAELSAFYREHGIDGKNPPSEAQIAEAGEEFVIPEISAQVEEIDALGRPEGEEEAVDAFVENAQSVLETAEEDPASLSDDGGGPFVEVEKEAVALGLPTCAE